MKRIRILLEYLAAFLLITVLLFLIASVVIVKFYGDEVQEYAMELINEQVDTKTSIDEIGISILRNFPNTSIYLNDVTVWSGHSFERAIFEEINPDTLFTADRIYLQLNIINLLRKKFTIKGLEARDAELRVLIDPAGNANYHFPAREKEKEGTTLIEMTGVLLKDVNLVYINAAKKIYTNATIRNLSLEGNFSREDYQLNTGADIYISRFSNKDVSYLENQDLGFDIMMEVAKNIFTISKGNIKIGNQTAGLSGEFLLAGKDGTDLDLHFEGKSIDLAWVSGILKATGNLPFELKGNGFLEVDADVVGLATSTLSPHVEATFSTTKAHISSDILPYKLSDIKLSGAFSNGHFNNNASSSVNIETFSTRFGNSNLGASLSIMDLTAPSVDLKLNGDISSKDLNGIFDKLPLEFKAGQIKPDLHVSGKLKNLGSEKSEVSIVPNGNIILENLDVYSRSSNTFIEKINGNIDMEKNTIKTRMMCSLGKTELNFNISADNLLPFISGKGPLKVSGLLESPHLDIDNLLEQFESNNEGERETEFPDNIQAEIDFSFGKISRGDIESDKVNGTIIYKYPGLFLEPFYLETMDGNINARVSLFDLNKDIHQIHLSSNFRNVNIRHICTAFNNFGQDFLTAENIAGTFTGEAEFLAGMNKDFSIISSSIVSENYFNIKDGALIDFKPMIELSKFLKIDKMDHIEFSTIENTILIKDNIIDIPQMDIESSLMKMQASGTHNFNKTFDYHLGIRLSELLFNKAKSSKKKEFEVALDKEDQRTVFLLLYDEGDGMIIDFDEDQALKKIRQDLKEEKTELKQVFNKEFGFFSKDEEVKKRNAQESAPDFEFEFDEEETIDSIPQNEPEKARWWKRKKDTSKKKELDFVIDDSDI